MDSELRWYHGFDVSQTYLLQTLGAWSDMYSSIEGGCNSTNRGGDTSFVSEITGMTDKYNGDQGNQCY